MRTLDLTRPPDEIDEHGRPVYRIDQERGLRDHMTMDLLRAPRLRAYTNWADERIFAEVRAEVAAAGRARLDIIEIGGGDGHFFDRVRDLARSYVNVEPSPSTPDAAALARLADGRYAELRCSALDIPLPDATADVVLAIAALDHLPAPDAALAEIRRVLRPDGTLTLTLNNAASWWKRLLAKSERLRERDAKIALDHHFQWSATQCERELAQIFPDVSVRTVRFVPYVPAVWRLGAALDAFVSGVGGRWGGDTIATARLRT
ncbi:MAG TPA: class I SAM-dependent methyltransferase [Candidatus Limnocylindria bacterium]|nr:class I SAM-dependent methyltransferase [Candidatus Limnocylindria bacterium]